MGDEAGDTGSAIHIGQGQGDSDISWPLTLDAYPLSDGKVCRHVSFDKFNDLTLNSSFYRPYPVSAANT